MKSQSFATISNVLLLIITLCITELVSRDVFKDDEPTNTTKKSRVNEDADVLNPLYIFK